MIPNIWEEFLTIIREEAGSRVVDTWFKAVSLKQWDAQKNIVYLGVPNHFVKEWLFQNYKGLMQTHLGRLLHVNEPNIVLLDSKASQSESANSVEKNDAAVVVVPDLYRPPKKQKRTMSLVKSRGQMNKSYSFDTFIVGSHNSLAHAAAYAITEKPGRLYNPFFIYGRSGLGKTHLLHAIGNQIKVRYEKLSVLYQTTDRFVNEFINAIRFDKIHAFQTKYKNVDVLLLDDVQFISHKEQTQEAFFHIFNILYDAHKQIVFSSDTFPHDIKGLAERLQSRLAWGLVADIQVPSLETKIAILKKKAESSNEILHDDVAHFIAARVDSNIRELEGSLIRVMAFALLTKQDISLELAKKVLIRSNKEKPKQVALQHVIKSVCTYYPYNADDLASKKRGKHLSFARHVAFFLMKQMTNKSLREIGTFLGGRDHTTVVHAINKIQQYADKNPDFNVILKRLESDIYSR